MNRTRIGTRLAALLGSGIVLITLAGCAGAVGTGGGSGAGGSGGGGSGAGGSGAGGSGAGGTGSSRDITGPWQLVSGTDAKGAISPGAAVVTFTIHGASSGGHGPCNSFGATAKGTTTGVVSIVIGMHTEIACVDPDLMTTETRYFAALDKVNKATLDNGTLTLSGDGDALVFTKASK